MANIFNNTQKHLVMTGHLENGLSMLPRKVKDLPGIAGLPVVSVLGQMDKTLEEKRYLLLAATPIAERSLTIQGIRVVVDSGKFNSLDILTDYCILLNYCTTLKCLSFFLRYFPREISDYSLRSRRFIFIFV